MNRFTVTWWDDAQQDLAHLWIMGDHRDTLNSAVRRIDTELSRDPHSKGREVSEGLRRIDVEAFRAYFTVSDDDRRVAIVGFRRMT